MSESDQSEFEPSLCGSDSEFDPSKEVEYDSDHFLSPEKEQKKNKGE